MSDMPTNHTHITAEWIRRPLDDLGGLSPTDAAANSEGRKKLDDLLVELAGHYVRLSNLGLPSVNPVDIRRALGLEAVASPAGPSGSGASNAARRRIIDRSVSCGGRTRVSGACVSEPAQGVRT